MALPVKPKKNKPGSLPDVSRNQLYPLLPRQMNFVYEYIKSPNTRTAAIAAGYSEKAAASAGFRLLQDPRVQELINTKRNEAAKNAGVTVDWIVERYKRIVDQDIRKLYHEDGSMKLPHDLDDDTAFAITSMESDTITVRGRGTNATTTITKTTKARRADQLRALDSLAKYLKMFNDGDGNATKITVEVVGGLPKE